MGHASNIHELYTECDVGLTRPRRGTGRARRQGAGRKERERTRMTAVRLPTGDLVCGLGLLPL